MATTTKTKKRITPRPQTAQNLRVALVTTNKQYRETLAKLAK
ncbi:MAG: hypothetical protein M0Z50_15125 [Planctomycetia bacterium]|nr:hypothetical protein [Planctomycetia bacterium]